MANERDWNVVESKIKRTNRENRKLCNSRLNAFSALAISTILDIDIDEAIAANTDGSNDRGIDAVVIKGNKIHLFQMKYGETVGQLNNNFKAAEIDKVSSYLVDFFSENLQAFENANKKIKQKTFEAMKLVSSSNSKIIVYFVCNTAGLIDIERKRASTVINKDDNTVKFEMYDLDRLANEFLKMRTPHLNRKINVDGKSFYPQKKHKNIRSLVCTVAAKDIVKMIESESNSDNVELDIFDQNVRVYLKPSNKNNRKIIESAIAEDNHMFWYQNNGITMTCDKFIKGAGDISPEISLKNVQIVNGGQTSISLFDAAKDDPEKIKDVLVPVRIIETGSEDIKISIAESTNSQTPITPRDLRANDREQRQIQDIFFDIGYFYERKKNEFEGKKKDKRIDALFAGQAYLAYGLEKPEVAKASRGSVFDNLYDDIFTENLNPMHLLISIKLSDLFLKRKAVLRRKIKNDETLIDGEESLMDGAFHALFALRKVLEKKGLDVWSYEEGKKYIDEAVGVIYEVYKDAKQTETNFSSNRFFKNTYTKKLIADRIEQFI